MSHGLEEAYYISAHQRTTGKILERHEENAEIMERNYANLEKINQKNLYYLGSALGVASEERMSRYALLAYIGSIFSVLNKKLGKDVVRQMLSLDTPDMERVLKEKLAEVEKEWVERDGGALGYRSKVGTKGILKNEHVNHGYVETIGMYEESFGKSISLKHTQDVGHAIDKNGAKIMLEQIQENRMLS